MSSYDLILKKEDKKIVLEYTSIEGKRGKPLGIASHELLDDNQTKIVFDDEKNTTLRIPPGKDGYTPIKGKDYDDGYTPQKGKDYFDGEDGISPIITTEAQEDKLVLKILDKEGEKKADILYGKDGEEGKPGPQGPEGKPGPKGDPFTYEDFTPEQLQGLKGPKGDKGEPFRYTDFTPEQLNGLKGDKGDGSKVTDVTTLENGNVQVTFNDSTTVEIPKGPKGDPFTYDDFTESQLQALKGPKGDAGVVDWSNITEEQKQYLIEVLNIPDVDLTPYAKTTDLKNYQPKGNYLTATDIASLASQTYVDNAIGAITDNDTTYTAGEGLNLTDTTFSVDETVAKKTDIPDTSNLATKDELPSIDGLASKTELNNYVEKVDGKVLSTNDFTNAHKTKVDNIPDGFEYKESIDESFVYNAISIENAFSKEADLYKYLNARTGLEFTPSIQTLEDLVNSETAMVAIASSEVGMKDLSASKIAMDSVSASKIAMDSVSASKIAMDSVSASKIAMDIILANETAMDIILASKIAMDSIAASKIAMDSVSASKIAMDSVSASKIAMDSIAASKIAMDSIAASKIAMDSVSASKIAMDSVSASKIAMDSIAANETAMGAITDSEFTISVLSDKTGNFIILGSKEKKVLRDSKPIDVSDRANSDDKTIYSSKKYGTLYNCYEKIGYQKLTWIKTASPLSGYDVIVLDLDKLK